MNRDAVYNISFSDFCVQCSRMGCQRYPDSDPSKSG